MSSRSSHRGYKPATAGFSLIEVLITLGIIAILTTLVMTRYGAFNSAVLLKNQAYEVALDMREAQVYAISVRADDVEFREEYGMYFNQPSASQQYTFWRDSGAGTPPAYTAGEELETLQLDSRFLITELCYDSVVESCVNTDSAHVSFARPNFDATIRVDGGTVANALRIVIRPVDNLSVYRSVYVTSTGLITVE